MFPGPYTYRCPVCQITADGLTKTQAHQTRTKHRRRIHGSPLARPDGERIDRAPYIDNWRGPAVAVAIFIALMLLAQLL